MRTIVTLTFLFLLILCSCQKEVDPTITTRVDSVGMLDDSTRLIKWIDFAYDQPIGQDTVVFGEYTFDNRKRIVQTDYVDFDTTLHQRDWLQKTLFYYNGVDTLPFKVMSLTEQIGFPVRTTFIYPKYLAGKIVSDSFVYTTGPSNYYRVINYSYFTNRTQINTKEFNPTGTINSRVGNVHFTKVNGNTATQKDSLSSSEPRYFTFSYDTHKNPFYKYLATSDGGLEPYYLRTASSTDMLFEKNNPTEIIESTYSGQLNRERYVYQYRVNGYPSSAKIYFVNNRISSVPDSVRRSYIYTKP